MPPNMSVRRITPEPSFTRSTAARCRGGAPPCRPRGRSKRPRRLPGVPPHARAAARNSVASCPCVTSTRPIMKTPWVGEGPPSSLNARRPQAHIDGRRQRVERRVDKRQRRAPAQPEPAGGEARFRAAWPMNWCVLRHPFQRLARSRCRRRAGSRSCARAARRSTPRPRSSMRPAMLAGAVGDEAAVAGGEHARGRRRRAARRARSARARARICRLPDAPRISTPFAPTSTAVAWTVSAMLRSSRGAGRITVKRAPSTLPSARLPVLGDDGAAMRLDDLPRDGEAEPGILAELVGLRAVGVEALEDALDVVGADAGPVVVDGHARSSSARAGRGCARCPPAARRTARCRSGC